MSLAPFLNPLEVSRGVAEVIRPPRRIAPRDAVADYLRTEKGEWSADLAPMFLEPLDELAKRTYQGICVVGPSRTSKTMTLVLGGITYVVTCAPADTLLVHTAQDKAREFSKKELDRAIRHSPELSARLSPSPRDDNVFDKFWRSGMVLNIGWPSVRQLSGSTYKYVFITDYDRPDNRDDVDGEGALWDLAFKRIATLMSRGKCVAESSPGGEYLDPQWTPKTPHEAPPASGILAIYNRGTRARWCWPCMHCGEFFQARPWLENFSLLPPLEELERMVLTSDLMALAEEFGRMPCPTCGDLHQQEQKTALNARGTWVHEGERVRADGSREGERRRTNIASFWQGGCSATYQSWVGLLFAYLSALQIYVRTSDESTLKATTNTDQAAPYLPRSFAKRRGVEQLMERANEDWPRGVVPEGVRFLTAAVDVQSNRFVVLVIGWGVAFESWVVDYFSISSSTRPEGERLAAIDPASYLEDWDVLREVAGRSYPVRGIADCAMRVLATFCDSGGRAGVTEKAYEFWRKLKKAGLGQQFMLIRGSPQMNVPRTKLTWPDARGRTDRSAGAKGDVPVWQLNVNVLKDGIAGDLAREVPGPGYVHLPSWLPRAYFDELTVETRSEKGWVKPHGARNEAFDLHGYNRGACIALGAEKIDWKAPPPWAVEPAASNAPKGAGRRVRSKGVR